MRNLWDHMVDFLSKFKDYTHKSTIHHFILQIHYWSLKGESLSMRSSHQFSFMELQAWFKASYEIFTGKMSVPNEFLYTHVESQGGAQFSV
ncbi:hypothetical protein LguiA_027457 [Lonicera macranthoides]